MVDSKTGIMSLGHPIIAESTDTPIFIPYGLIAIKIPSLNILQTYIFVEILLMWNNILCFITQNSTPVYYPDNAVIARKPV